MDITVVIATYGDEMWGDLAMSRAYPSAVQAAEQHGPRWQTPRVMHVHHGNGTLATARNEGLRRAETPYVIVLDADDELDAGYVRAMSKAVADNGRREALYTPLVQYVMGRKRYHPRFNQQVPFEDGNWLVIGTMLPREQAIRVGGFEEWPLYEDWAMFARLQKAGVPVVKVPGAVYVAHRSHRSRNHPAGGRRAKQQAHDMIRRAVFPELYGEAADAA